MNKNLKTVFIILVSSSILFASDSVKGSLELTNTDTVLSVGGRIQLDNTYGWPEGIHGAKTIPLETTGEQGQLTMSAKFSRIWVKTRTPTEYGVVRTLIETDFAGVQGTETNTNSHGLRLRHAYAQLGNWTIGQTNSAFNAYVTLDILITAINDTFVRQPLIRYGYENKLFSYDISFEQPETTLIDSDGEIITPKDDVVPDIIARVVHYPKWGEVALSVMGRYITQDHATLSDGTVLNSNDSAFGWGANLSGKIKVFDLDNIRFASHYGVGIGRYLAYNAYAAGSISRNGDIDLQASFGGDIGYQHWWNQKLRSTISISYAGTKNNLDNLTSFDNVNKDVYSSQLNLLWMPIPNSLVGVEYASAKRRVESSKEGDMEMLILLFRYDF
ncbi:MAG: DcaP family trimeric outer membrane transporter [Campylobacterota bacterium]|nr:DcaP family trimeric outer membrane transporter [Campylobacterota bacterium]